MVVWTRPGIRLEQHLFIPNGENLKSCIMWLHYYLFDRVMYSNLNGNGILAMVIFYGRLIPCTDVVNIVFLEKDAQFDPSAIKSNFTHVFLIVQETKEDANGNKGFVLSTASNQDVPNFGPTLPEKGYFGNRYDFRDFLMAKSEFFQQYTVDC